MRWEQDNVFIGKAPGIVIIGLLKSKNHNGTLNCYPYAFEKFGVTYVRPTPDGEEYSYRALELTGNTKAEDLVGYDSSQLQGCTNITKHLCYSQRIGEKARIVPSSCSIMSQGMPMILKSETPDKQAMYGMRLASGQRLVIILP